MIAVSINLFFGGKNMYKSMKILIGRKFYKTKEQACSKIDVFFMCNRLTEDEYRELNDLIIQVYGADEAEGNTPEAEA